MFHPIKNGTFEIVGEHYKCWIPPKPPDAQIAGWNLKKEDQYWRRTLLPEWWEERTALEAEKRAKEEELVESGKIDKVSYVDPMCEKFRRQEWDRRLNGFWFFNNGKATYITGPCYYYLNWCRFDHEENEGYPVYNDGIRKRFYFYQYCQEDKLCLGYILIGGRGFGKTTEQVSLVIEDATKPPHRKKTALQSKSEDDAIQKIFAEKVVPCYNSLPDFFKPISNHSSKAESKLSFFRSAKRGRGAKKIKYSDELELQNEVYPVTSTVVSLDGGTFRNILCDEIGKTKDIDVHERHGVNKFCVYRNDRKVGMIRCISTVEEMEAGAQVKGLRGLEACQEIWKDSDPLKRNDNGVTMSGLYRYFVSCIETTTQFQDKYGFIDEDKANKFHDNERISRKNDWVKYTQYIRKNPRNASEAFIKDTKNTTFNTQLLTDWIIWAQMHPNVTVKGNLDWKDKVDGDVVFERNDHSGRWEFSVIPDQYGGPFMHYASTKIVNNVGEEIDFDGKPQYKPRNARLMRLGCDPIKNIKTNDPRASHLSMHCIFLYDDTLDKGTPMKDWKSHKIFMKYNARPDDPKDSYEDVIKTLRYLSCPINAEKNISDLHSHIESRGYGKFLMRKKDFDPSVLKGTGNQEESIQSNSPVISTYIGRIKGFLKQNNERFEALPFETTLQQLNDYDALNPTRFDEVVSLGYTLLAIEAQWEEDLDHVNEVTEWFDMFDNSGTISRTVDEEEFYQELL